MDRSLEELISSLRRGVQVAGYRKEKSFIREMPFKLQFGQK